MVSKTGWLDMTLIVLIGQLNTNPTQSNLCHGKRCLRTYAGSEGPDQPMHQSSLIWEGSHCLPLEHWVAECINGAQRPV